MRAFSLGVPDRSQAYLIMLRPSPRAAAYGLASLVALVLACDLLWMPVQVSDSLGELLEAQRSPSARASFEANLGSAGYLRPLRIAQIKVLYDAAQGSHYWLVFRGLHALLIGVALFLFTRVLRVSTRTDFAAAAFALVTLTGLHTFRGTVQEAFPINHFLEMLVCCLLALNLARSRGRYMGGCSGDRDLRRGRVDTRIRTPCVGGGRGSVDCGLARNFIPWIGPDDGPVARIPVPSLRVPLKRDALVVGTEFRLLALGARTV